MFPKVFETTLYRDTEQITVCPRRDLLISPPASLSVYLQRQAEYTPTIDTNRVSLQVFFLQCHGLTAYPRAIYDPTMVDSIDFRERIQLPSQPAGAGRTM